MLCPDNAVYGLRGGVTYGAAREGLGGRRRGALIALTVTLDGRKEWMRWEEGGEVGEGMRGNERRDG